MGALLASFLRELPTALDQADGAAAAAVPGLLRNLLAASLPAQAALGSARSGERPLRDRARRFIAYLSAALTVNTICEALGASRASLYRAFDNRGGVMSLVLEQRLQRARRMLAGDGSRCSTSDIARATGFRDASDLGRAFRQRFSVTPGAVRRGNASKPVPAGTTQARFRSWAERESQ